MIEDDGTSARRNVGFELGDGPIPRDAEVTDAHAAIDPLTVERITSRYGAYLRIAEESLVINEGGLEAAIRQIRPPGTKPARLNDDFYRLVLADYEQRQESGSTSPMIDLANAYYVDKSTASRWIKEAQRRRDAKRADDA